MNTMVDKKSIVITDKWGAYPLAAIEYEYQAKLSDQGANFKLLHWHIFNLKNWIRGMHHHHISNEHAQHYIDEFHFRFNRRDFSQSSVIILLKRMINEPWMPYEKAKGN